MYRPGENVAYIGFGHWLDFGFCSRQHLPLACTYARCYLQLLDLRPEIENKFAFS